MFFLCRYMYTRDFDHTGKNYLSPSPDWDYKPTNRPVSTTAPVDESEPGSMKFELWKEIGDEFLIKNTINNWLHCVPNGGSLVEMITGPVLCNVTKVIVEGICEDKVPHLFEGHSHTPALWSPSGLYYYFHTSDVATWPVSDPCGRTQQNQLKNTLNPAGWIFVREMDELVPNVREIMDSKNSSSK